MFENTANPHDPGQLQIYWDLARQTHWHVFVLGAGNEVLNWFEFRNNFKLEGLLERTEEVADRFSCKDFGLAKREFEACCSLDDLFDAHA